MFEREILEIYQRLPYHWRFLGPIFRRAVRELDPVVAAIPYSNTGVSAFAHPQFQALAFQGRATWRANVNRARRLAQWLGVPRIAPASGEQYGSYHHSAEMALAVRDSTPRGHEVRALLVDGPLARAGILDAGQLPAALARCAAGDNAAGFTVMSWVALALWLERYPAHMPIGGLE